MLTALLWLPFTDYQLCANKFEKSILKIENKLMQTKYCATAYNDTKQLYVYVLVVNVSAKEVISLFLFVCPSVCE